VHLENYIRNFSYKLRVHYYKITLEENDLLLVNDGINTNHQHNMAVEKEEVLLDYSKDRISIKYKMTFIPLYRLRTELIGHSGPRRMNSLYINEKDSTSLLSPLKVRLQRQKCSPSCLERRRFFLNQSVTLAQ